MMTLGAVVFSVRTSVFQRVRRTTAYRWPSHERVGRLPTRQFTGPGDDKINLDGVIMPTYRGSVGAVEALRELALTGERQQLSAGAGDVFGLWCIEQIEEDRSGLFADGAPRRVAWVLQLARYGDDAPGGLQSNLARSSAVAGDMRSVLDAMSRSVGAGDGPVAVVDRGRAAAGGPSTEARRVVLPAAQAAADNGGAPRDVRDAAYNAGARSPQSAPAPSAPQAPDVAYRVADGEMLDEIRVTSSSDSEIDTLELAVSDDIDSMIGVPGEARELHVFLGYGERLAPMGIYYRADVDIELVPRRLVVRATAADLRSRSSLKEPRDRAWSEVTLGSLVADVAAAHGYAARVDPSLADSSIAHID